MDKEKYNLNRKEYREKHKEQISEYCKNRYQEKKDYFKRYYEKNRDQKLVYMKEYRQRNKDRLNQKDKEYAVVNREKIKKYHRVYHYGLSEDGYQLLIITQKNKCAICGKDFTFENKSTTPHVDHDHRTGTVRGLLCGRCNVLLGFAEDDATLLITASQYLHKENREELSCRQT